MDQAYSVLLILGAIGRSIAIGETRVFTKKPGHLLVLEKTTAVLDWRHSISNINNVSNINAVDIAWYLRRATEMIFTEILTFSYDTGPYAANSEQSTRLSYVDEPDSAAMKIDWATERDDGHYKVKVMDPTDPGQGGFYIDDTARLETVKVSALNYTVVVGNETFQLTVADNGTSVTLPRLSVAVSDRVHIKVFINQTAPQADILMATSIGDSIEPELPCGKTERFCERNVPVILGRKARPGRDHGRDNISVSLDFGVQNLPVVHVVVPLEINIPDTGGQKPFKIALGICIPIVCVCLIFLAVLLSRSGGHRGRRRQNHSGDKESQSTETETLNSDSTTTSSNTVNNTAHKIENDNDPKQDAKSCSSEDADTESE